MWLDFDEELPEASYLVQAYSLTTDEISEMIDEMVLNGTTAIELACNWILGNEEKWENWVVIGKRINF
jgi:ABC-type proline/glycine betaine transport system substrate-binding protein